MSPKYGDDPDYATLPPFAGKREPPPILDRTTDRRDQQRRGGINATLIRQSRFMRIRSL